MRFSPIKNKRIKGKLSLVSSKGKDFTLYVMKVGEIKLYTRKCFSNGQEELIKHRCLACGYDYSNEKKKITSGVSLFWPCPNCGAN